MAVSPSAGPRRPASDRRASPASAATRHDSTRGRGRGRGRSPSRPTDARRGRRRRSRRPRTRRRARRRSGASSGASIGALKSPVRTSGPARLVDGGPRAPRPARRRCSRPMYVRCVVATRPAAARRPRRRQRSAARGGPARRRRSGRRPAGGRHRRGSTRSSSAARGRPSAKPSRERRPGQDRVAPHRRRRSPGRSPGRRAGTRGSPRTGRAGRSAAPARPAGRGRRRPAVMIVTSWRVTMSASSAAMNAAIRSSRSRRTCRHQAGGNGSPGPDRRPDVPGDDAEARRRRPTRPSRDCRRLLDRAREQALDEVALEAEEDEQRHGHQDERAAPRAGATRCRTASAGSGSPWSSATSRRVWTKTSAISRSFQTHRNWKIP